MVVVVGATWIFVLFRVGYTRLSPMIFGVNVANEAFAYIALRIPVCPREIVGVGVVSEQNGVVSTTLSTHVHSNELMVVCPCAIPCPAKVKR